MDKKIVFIGGCHVVGFPFEGYDKAFSEVACRLSGISIISSDDMFSLVALKNLNIVIESIKDKKISILVLQLGNYETSKGFSVSAQSLRRSYQSTKNTNLPVSNKKPDSIPDFSRIFSPGLRWKIVNIIRLVISIILGDFYFSRKKFNSELYNFCTAISQLNIPHVIMLSPLPCADSVFMRNRLSVNNFFRIISLKLGFEYVDVIPHLLNANKNNDIFYDAFHLSIKGHKILGEIVAAKIT